MNRMRTSARLAMVLALAVPSMRAASFDCGRAVSPMEKAICSDKGLGAADSAMASAYRQALALMPPEGASTFRADQRRWLETLQRGCQIAEVATAGSDGRPADVAPDSPAAQANLKRIATCMTPAYADRIDVLKHGYASVDGVAFVTRSLTLLSPDGDTAPENEAFPGFGSLNISWPEAQSTDPRWLAWNAAVVQKLQAALQGQGSGFRPGWRESMAADMDSTLLAQVPVVAQGRVRIAVVENTMGHGAAHPNEQFFTFTWLLDAQRALKATDVFRPGTRWKQALAAYAWQDVKARAGLYDTVPGAQNKALLDDIADLGNWTLTAHGLSLSWPEYTLAPRAYPMDDTLVPWSVLRPLLVPGFVP